MRYEVDQLQLNANKMNVIFTDSWHLNIAFWGQRKTFQVSVQLIYKKIYFMKNETDTNLQFINGLINSKHQLFDS